MAPMIMYIYIYISYNIYIYIYTPCSVQPYTPVQYASVMCLVSLALKLQILRLGGPPKHRTWSPALLTEIAHLTHKIHGVFRP